MITPTLQELKAQIQTDLEQEMGISGNFQKKILAAFAAVMAAVLKTMYLSIAAVQKNIFFDTADSETTGGTLERFGRVYLNRNPNPATQGVYEATVTGVAGGVVLSGTTFRDANTNSLYQVEADVTLIASTATITLRALEAGKTSELFTDNEVVSTIPIVDVDSTATISAVTTEPENEESTEDYRAKIAQAVRLESQGGSTADYRIWASDAASIRQVYPFAGSEAGIINLYAESNDAGLIPSGAALAELEAVINFEPVTSNGRRPVSAWQINYLPVTPLNVDIEITGLNDSSAGVITAITNALTSFLLEIRPFIAGADNPNNVRDTLRLSDVNEVISNALVTGNFFESVQLEVDNNIVSSYRFTESNVPILNTVTAV
jgi:uncharacterized phage protein gp47/JayE